MNLWEPDVYEEFDTSGLISAEPETTWRCPKPYCPIDHEPSPRPNPACMCGKALMIVIPPGHHVHPCPVHPDKFIRGSDRIKF